VQVLCRCHGTPLPFDRIAEITSAGGEGDLRRSLIQDNNYRLDPYGVRGYEMWEVSDKTGDWGSLLAMFASTAEGVAK
jgi:hypothetical protein